MSEQLHLVLGDSAAGSIRAACRSHGLQGTLLGIRDDLSHGPLTDGQARIDYMRACYRGYDDWTFDATDAFEPWQKLTEQLEREQPEAVVIWSGDNVSEGTFLRMACWLLRAWPAPLLHVLIEARSNPPYVALHRPAELAGRYSTHHEITLSERDALGQDFERIRGDTGLLRRHEQGRIIGVPIDHYDGLLLRVCSADWTPAPRVVGAAMGQCDQHNLLSDLFFTSRLQVLINAGAIEADGVRRHLSNYSVRLAPNSLSKLMMPS